MNRTSSTIAIVALAIVAASTPYWGIPAWAPSLATTVVLLSTSLIGLNLIFGNLGMLALGQAAFVALPGYFFGLAMNLHAPWLLAAVLALVGTVAIANVIGRIFIRLPGIYFAVGTLGFAFVVEGLTRAFPSVTGGASGLVFAQAGELSVDAWYALSIALLLVGLGVYALLVKGASGRTLKVVQCDELAASVLGIDVARTKLRAFTIGCAFSAAGGLPLAIFVGVLVPENAGVNRSLEMVGMVMLGGAGWLLGPLLGTALVQWLFAISGAAKEYEVLIYGVAFLGAVLFARQGLAGGLTNLIRTRTGTATASAIDSGRAPLPRSILSARAAASDGSGEVTVDKVAKRFGGVLAISDVSFTVSRGQVLALVGPNGAGKTTLFNIVSGLEVATAGEVFVHGQRMTGTAVHTRAAVIGRSFQVARLVPHLTALENVMCRLDQLHPRADERDLRSSAMSSLEAFGLSSVAGEAAGRLSAGQRKLVDVVRAAAGSPSVLLLDEPAVGLSEDEVDMLARFLQSLRTQGTSVVLVEHNIDFVSRVATSAVVLHGGVVIASGPIEDVFAHRAVQDAYLGALA